MSGKHNICLHDIPPGRLPLAPCPAPPLPGLFFRS